MLANFWHKGESIDYINPTSKVIPANTVVAVGNRIGIAGTEIAPETKGSLVVEGVFILEKKTSSEEIELGAEVYLDGEGVTATKPEGSDIVAGWVVESSTATDTTVKVKIG